MLTTSGLGSGLDINGLVSSLVAAERSGSDLQLNRQNAKLSAKFSALGSLKGAVSVFQSSLNSLNTLSNFSKNTASSSDSSELSVTANSDAVSNNYSIDVTQLATSHSLASTAFADSDSTALGAGTLTIRFGSTDYTPGSDTYNSFVLNPESSVATIDIDSSNNTLEGIMGAINDADIGVNASIVNDGTGFRLLMSSEATGEENSLEISVSDDDTNDIDASGLSRFTFNSAATHFEQTAAAQDALFTTNGLAVSSASNIVDSAIAGVTLTLKAVSSSTINVAIQPDTNTVINGVNNFIAGYNQFVATAAALSAYDAEDDVPAVLVGDFTLRSINGQIDSIIRNAVAGLSGSINNLSELGVTTTSSGSLVLDSAKLNAALAENPAEVAQIFAAVGVPDDADISFKGSNSSTVVGNYAVEITTLASAGVFNSGAVLPDFGGGGTLVIDDANNNLTVEIDGIDSGEITLTAGTYTTGKALADEIQSRINGSSALRTALKTVAVTYDSGTDSFSITSNSLGSSSSVNTLAVDTNTVAMLGFSVNSGTDGNDVAGIIDGIVANGAGNILVAASGSDAEGLSLVIGGTTTGSRGNVNFSKGLANQLNALFVSLLDGEGALVSRIDSFQGRIEEVSERRAAKELHWEAVEARYMRQFNALDSLLAGLQSTSAYMEGQFNNLLDPYTGGGR